MIDHRIPKLLHPMFERYIALVNKDLPNLMSAFYIVGSIALNGFNEKYSDVDFVAVLHQRANGAAIEKLANIHKIIARDFPASKLSGSYLQVDDLGHLKNEIAPHPYYHDGTLHDKGYFEINSITWWILKKTGHRDHGSRSSQLTVHG